MTNIGYFFGGVGTTLLLYGIIYGHRLVHKIQMKKGTVNTYAIQNVKTG